MTLPVIDPATFLPRPTALETVDFESYWSAWLTQMLVLMPSYNVANRKSDPGVIVSRAMTYMRMLDRVRVNEAYAALRLALAEDTDLDGLAADRGVRRRVFAPATATAPAVVEGNDSLRLRAFLEMQRWARGGTNLGMEGAAWGLAMPDASDLRVYDFPGQGRMRCVLLPQPGNDAPTTAAMLARVSQGVMRRDTRFGSVPTDTVLAEVLTVDIDVRLGVLPGASQSAAKSSAETAIEGYMARRRSIGARVARSLVDKNACVSNVVYAHLPNLPEDLLPGREQAYQLGRLTVVPERADG